MSAGGSANLALRPDLCDNCGRCVAACPRGQLRVGRGYIYVDASACDGCMSCASVCDRGAISVRKSGGHGGGLAVKPGEVARVVVGSRAEAKALRKAAAASAKADKPGARPKGVSATGVRGASGPSSAAPVKRPGTASTSKSPQPSKPSTRQASVTTDGAVWTATDAVAVGAVLIASLVAKEAVLRSSAVGLMPLDGKAMARALVLVVFYTAQVLLLAYLAHRRGMTLAQAFRLRAGSGDVRAILGSVGLVTALLVGTRAVSTGWGALAQAVGWTPPASEALSGLFGTGTAGLALTVALVVLVAPVIEELAFRGVIAGALDVRYGLRVAVLASAAAFAGYHVTLWVVVPTFVLGAALAWLALTRETLWPAVSLHVLYNGVVVAAVFWLR